MNSTIFLTMFFISFGLGLVVMALILGYDVKAKTEKGILYSGLFSVITGLMMPLLTNLIAVIKEINSTHKLSDNNIKLLILAILFPVVLGFIFKAANYVFKKQKDKNMKIIASSIRERDVSPFSKFSTPVLSNIQGKPIVVTDLKDSDAIKEALERNGYQIVEINMPSSDGQTTTLSLKPLRTEEEKRYIKN